ncbi:hypothetical protein DSECCO2_517780 [anaerobic digester metagenome]
MYKNEIILCSQRFLDTDDTNSFADGDKHDVGNAETAHQKRKSTNKPSGHGDNIKNTGQPLCEHAGLVDGKIIPDAWFQAMPCPHDACDFIHHLFVWNSLFPFHSNEGIRSHFIVNINHLTNEVEWHHDEFIVAVAEIIGAFLFQHSYNLYFFIEKFYILPERIVYAKKFF